MAGYCGLSKSNNAITAESEGKFPASVLAKRLGVKTGAIKALMTPCEWHHTSKHYNCTDYYDGELLECLDLDDAKDWGYDEDATAEGLQLLDSLRKWEPPKKNTKTWRNCTVSWLEWGGTRKHPTVTEETADGCTVDWKGGKFCVVTFADGATMRKGTNTRGFEVRDQTGARIYF